MTVLDGQYSVHTYTTPRLLFRRAKAPSLLRIYTATRQSVRSRPARTGTLFFLSFILSSFHSFFHPFIHSFILSFILSSFHSFILSFIHSFILSFFHSFILSFIPFPSLPTQHGPRLVDHEPAGMCGLVRRQEHLVQVLAYPGRDWHKLMHGPKARPPVQVHPDSRFRPPDSGASISRRL